METEIEAAMADIKTAIKNGTLSEDDLHALGMDKDGASFDMKRADKRIQDMDEFAKDIEDFVSCRQTEVD